MLSLPALLLVLSAPAASPQNIHIDPRVQEAARQNERDVERYTNKKTGQRNDKAICRSSCATAVSMCMSTCKGAKPCKDNCTKTVESNCLKGCAGR